MRPKEDKHSMKKEEVKADMYCTCLFYSQEHILQEYLQLGSADTISHISSSLTIFVADFL